MNLILLWRKLLKDEGITLRRRWLYTALLLLGFRLLAHIPIVKVDEDRLHHLLADNPLVGLLDLFAGGEVLSKFSLVAAGILPYILAQTLATAATFIVPHFKELRRRGEAGKKRLEHYTTFLSIPVAFIFGWLLSHFLIAQSGLFPGHIHWFTRASFWSSFWIVSCVTGGSLISTGIGKLITIKGIGPGEDLILVAGSSYALAQQAAQVVRGAGSLREGIQSLGIALAVGVAVIVYSIYLLQAVRRIAVQYAKRISVSSRRRSDTDYLPFLLDSGRTLPASAAVGCFVLLKLIWPGSSVFRLASDSSGWHWFALACLTIFFTYIVNFSLLWPPDGGTIADVLRKNGVFIPGVQPGLKTAEYLSHTMSLLTLPGGIGLALVTAGLPYVTLRLTGLNVIVAVLAVMLVVERVDRLYSSEKSFRIRESYSGFIHSRL